MLVLSRRAGQNIVIADNIKIKVLEVKGGRVRLGIEAPREIPVHRSEVAAAMAARCGQGKGSTATAASQQTRRTPK